MAVESISAKLYFEQWNLPAKFNWNGRHGRTSYNVNALDPINAALNMGYSMLAQRMSEILMKRGFELSIGFMHMAENNIYWNMLTYDFIEPFRVWIDTAIKDMVKQSVIEPDDFTFSEDRSHLIVKDKSRDKILIRFIETLEPLEHKSIPMIRQIEAML